MHIRAKDRVVVITGKDKGKEGEVLSVIPYVDKTDPNNRQPSMMGKNRVKKYDRVIVEGVNICKRHMRPQQQGGAGQIVSKEAAIAASNVMLICPKCKRGVRVGYQVLENGNKVRVCKKCGTTID